MDYMEATSEGNLGSNANQNLFERELKYVRWPHEGRPDSDELTVDFGDEVEIINREGSHYWKVKLEKTGAIGLIPAKCFYPRVKAHCDRLPNQTVDEGEVVGIIEKQVEGDNVRWKIMKSDGTEVLLPSHCFDKGLARRYHVPVMPLPTEHCEDTNKPPAEMQVQLESQENPAASNCVYRKPRFTIRYDQPEDFTTGKQEWKPNYLYEGGLKYVRWPHTARPELTVKNGDEVEILEGDFWKVKLLETGAIGVIPAKCFYPRVKAKRDHLLEAGTEEISVREGEVVGIIEQQVEGDNIMWKIMKSDGSKGLVPGGVLNAYF